MRILSYRGVADDVSPAAPTRATTYWTVDASGAYASDQSLPTTVVKKVIQFSAGHTQHAHCLRFKFEHSSEAVETRDAESRRRLVTHTGHRLKGAALSLWSLLKGEFKDLDEPRHIAFKCFLACLGVMLGTVLIGLSYLMRNHVYLDDPDLIYVFVVLGVAMRLGRLAAVVGSIVAFAANMFFFEPYIHRLANLLVFFALIVVGYVVGHYVRRLHERVNQEAETAQRQSNLYRSSRLIAGAATATEVARILNPDIVRLLAPAGARAVALVSRNQKGELVARHVEVDETQYGRLCSDDNSDLCLRSERARLEAEWAWEHRNVTICYDRSSAALLRPGDAATYFLPLEVQNPSDGREEGNHAVVGLLGISGTWNTSVATLLLWQAASNSVVRRSDITARIDLDSLRLRCDQLALVLRRNDLERRYIEAKAAAASETLKEDLLFFIAHDHFRRPVRKLLGLLTEHLSIEKRDDVEIAYFDVATVEAMRSDLNQLGGLLDKSLGWFKLKKAAFRPPTELYHPDELICNILQEKFEGPVARRLRCRCDPGLPKILVDESQMKQLVTNLVENAIKWSPPDSQIEIRARIVHYGDRPEEVEISVTDHGCGIPKQDLGRVFETWYQAKRDRIPAWMPQFPEGHGLGLAICRRIVLNHEGSIWAESPGSGGTIIRVTLPISTKQVTKTLPLE